MDNLPIRVLHVVTIMNLGGIETFLMSLYRNVDRTKVQFDFLVHREDKGDFDDEIIKLGGRIYYQTKLNPLTYIGYKSKLKKFFNNHPYRIVHSHLNANSSIVLRIAKECNIPIRIAHVHTDRETSGIKGFLKNFNKRFIINTSNYRFACSIQAGKWLFNSADFLVVNNAIETSKFEFDSTMRDTVRKELNISDSTYVLGYIARFNAIKNHKFLIDVFNAFVKINSNSKLLLVGDGELLDESKSYVNELNLTNHVEFLGAKKNANDYLNAMDVFVFPSLFEGLGIVAIEAQTNGIPVVMTDTLPDEIDITNLIYRQSLNDSPDIWASKCLEVIIEHKNRYSRTAEITEHGYDVTANAKYLEDFYLNH